MFSYFFMKVLMFIIKLFEAPKRNVFKSKKCVFSSSRIGTGRVKDILQTAYFANIHDFRSKCNLFNCTIPIMHNHTKSIYRRCSEELFYHYHHHWIISFWTFAAIHHSIYTSKRNRSNNHSSQDASRTLTGYIMENTGYRHNKKEYLRWEATSRREELKLN